jgi:hypothetical protein
MINKGQIQSSLVQINNSYNKSRRRRQALYFSKLAILELCGWIEESMDNIIETFTKHLNKPANLAFVREQVIEHTYGFEYHRYFRPMLIQVIGVINVERLEANLNQTKFDMMKSSLASLKKSRNDVAHTHVKDTTVRIDAPSITQNRFQIVYDGLKDIESCIRKMKL